MTASSALSSGLRVLVDRPASVLPIYLLVVGLTATARAPIILAIGLIVVLAAADGRLEAVATEIEAALAEFDGEAAAEPPDELPAGLETALVDLFTPTVLALLAAGVLLAVVAALLATAVGNAAAINGIYGALYAERPVHDAVVGIASDWQPFLGVALLKIATVVIAAIPVVIGAGLLAVSPLAGGVGLVLGGFVGGLIAVGGLLLLAFAGQSIVVDDAGFKTAIRQSATFPLRQPVGFVAYILVAIGLFAGVAIAGTVFSVLGVSQLSGILGPLIAYPFFDAFKTALYADRPFQPPAELTTTSTASSAAAMQPSAGGSTTEHADEAPADTPPSPLFRLIAAFRDGVVALGGFLRHHPTPVVAATTVFALAAVGGHQLTATITTDIPLPEDVAGIFGVFPVDTFIMLAANNWLVSATAAYSGVVLGIPTTVDLLLNGAIVGAVYGLTEPIAFAALVAPHGVIELPAIFVAGGLGFHLAVLTLGVLTGRGTTDDLADALQLVYRVLLGLAVVLIIAAFVEAFLTPLIAAAVLG